MPTELGLKGGIMELIHIGGQSGTDISCATFHCDVAGSNAEILELRKIILRICDDSKPFTKVVKNFYKINANDAKIIFNPPATIVFRDDKKAIAKCHPDDDFNEETGLMVALLKSFGIKYSDLQEMLKNAKRPQSEKASKIKEVDIEEGKSFVGAGPIKDAIKKYKKLCREYEQLKVDKPKRGRLRKEVNNGK